VRFNTGNVIWGEANEMNRYKCRIPKRVRRPDDQEFALRCIRKGSLGSEGFVEGFLRHNGHQKAIQNETINIFYVYTNGVSNNLGNAHLVYERFYVIRNVTGVCQQVRTADSQADPKRRDQLERTRWM
jgi:hypothetical protein